MNADTLSGIETIMLERLRQIRGEGWSDEHDDQHRNGELAVAAAQYALPEPLRRQPGWRQGTPKDWPWADAWWKPTPDDRIRELAKAGALIAAEIDRLRRLAARAAR